MNGLGQTSMSLLALSQAPPCTPTTPHPSTAALMWMGGGGLALLVLPGWAKLIGLAAIAFGGISLACAGTTGGWVAAGPPDASGNVPVTCEWTTAEACMTHD